MAVSYVSTLRASHWLQQLASYLGHLGILPKPVIHPQRSLHWGGIRQRYMSDVLVNDSLKLKGSQQKVSVSTRSWFPVEILRGWTANSWLFPGIMRSVRKLSGSGNHRPATAGCEEQQPRLGGSPRDGVRAAHCGAMWTDKTFYPDVQACVGSYGCQGPFSNR